MLKKTPLNEAHRAASARMVDFGGWDMPVHYGSQIEEHHAVRRDAGLFDVAHRMVLLDLGAVVHRHVPAAEIDHAGAGRSVHRIEGGGLGQFFLRWP